MLDYKMAVGRNIKVSLRILALATFFGVITFGAIIAVIFQDNITRYQINPRIPYQIYTAPPPPAYTARGAWAIWPDDPQYGAADIFYLHSTTYTSSRHWNSPILDPQADRLLRTVAAPNEAGPFEPLGAIYGPRYRQATLFASFTHKFDGLAAYQLAYGDVEKAFRVFLDHRQRNRPFVLVGYGQGGLHVIGLLQNIIAPDDALRAQLAVAYVINQPMPLGLFDTDLQYTPPCKTPQDTSCVVAYIDLENGFKVERRRYRKRSLIWAAPDGLTSLSSMPLLCVNPLSWSVTEDYIEADHHLGAASATGLRLGETPPAISSATSAECINGILAVDSPSQTFLRRHHWFGAHWRPQHFNLFYHDLAADVERRVKIHSEKHDLEQGNIAAPVDPGGKPANNPREE